MATLIIGVIVGIIVICAAASYIKQLKSGGCGCGCAGCTKKCGNRDKK